MVVLDCHEVMLLKKQQGQCWELVAYLEIHDTSNLVSYLPDSSNITPSPLSVKFCAIPTCVDVEVGPLKNIFVFGIFRMALIPQYTTSSSISASSLGRYPKPCKLSHNSFDNQ